LALLRLAQGRTRVAEASVRRALLEAQGATARAAILPGFVEIMLAIGEVALARTAVGELAAIAAATESEYLRGAGLYADGATSLAEGEPGRALVSLRRAGEIWQRLDAAHEGARNRILIARACRELGDEDAARLEVEAARKIFVRLGANHDLALIDKAARPHDESDHHLSKRELEVAELVAAGLSNRAIAKRLFLSERTAESHIKHICDKLGFNSRSQVAAWVGARRA
jgi:DNA-binding CsgD family transcriptional regulator